MTAVIPQVMGGEKGCADWHQQEQSLGGGIGCGRQDWGSSGSSGELMPARPMGHGQDGASGTQKDLSAVHRKVVVKV